MKLRNFILGVIIAFVFLFFCVYGAKLISPEPQYESYCNRSYYYPDKISLNCSYNTQIEQTKQGCYNQGGDPDITYDSKGCESSVSCDFCRKNFENANEDYAKSLFLVSVIFSLIIIVLCVVLIKVEPVSSGLMFGSLMFIIYGCSNYWRYMEDWTRFIILGVALIVLIYVGYYLAKKKE